MRKTLMKRLICLMAAVSLVFAACTANAREEVVLTVLGDYLTAGTGDEALFSRLYEPQLTKNFPYLEFVYERLFEYIPAPDPAYNPVLAQSFSEEPYGDAGSSYIIELKRDAFWHDGEPFTSADVLSSFYLGFLSGWQAWDYIDSISAPDDYTLVINVRESGPLITKIILAGEVIACPEHLYSDLSNNAKALLEERGEDGLIGDELRAKIDALEPDVSREAIGTGVYKIGSVSSASVELVRSAHSPFNAEAKVDRLVISNLEYLYEDIFDEIEFDKAGFVEWFIEDYVGESDGVVLMDEHLMPLSDQGLETMRSIFPNLQVIELPGRNKLSFEMNLSYYPLSESIMRKAIQFIIDRQELISSTEPSEQTGSLAATNVPDGYLTGMPDGMRDIWLDDEFKSRLTEYGCDPNISSKLLSGIGMSIQGDGFYQDENFDVPVIEVISYEPTLFYAPFEEYAGKISAQLSEAGVDSDTYFYDRSDYISLTSEDWLLRFAVTHYDNEPYDIFGGKTDRVVLSDGTIVFLDAVMEQLLLSKAGVIKQDEIADDGEAIEDSGEAIEDSAEALAADEALRDKQALVQALAVLYNDLAMEIAIGDTPTAFTVCMPGWAYPDETTDWRYYGTGFEPLNKLLRTGGLCPL